MSERPRSATAWTGAAIAVGLFGAVVALSGHLDLPLILAGLVSICLGGWLGGRGREAPPPRPAATAQRHAIAEALLAHVPDPVILVDRRTLVVEANPAARALLPALHQARPLSFALRSPEVLDGVEAVLSSGMPRRVSLATRVPLERIFEVQIGALPMPDGSGVSAVLFLRDLTSARRLEAMRVDFVANASHELRTPLAALLGFIETLQGSARDDARAREQFLGIMQTQAQRMTGLIDDLLSLSRIELHEHVVPTQMVDFGRIARQMVDMQAPLALKRGVALSVERPDLPLPVLGDRNELLRVIENLVENAVKYGGSGGMVVVSLHRVEELDGRAARIELRVRDAGPGIAAEHIPRLTERFYRVDTASSRQQGGTGLGLAIVKHTLNRHRGKLIIESEPGHGTTVRVSLPEHRPNAEGAMPDELPVRD